MHDREKVITALELHIAGECQGTNGQLCPYWQDDVCVKALHADVLALLKEQDAVEPRTGHWIEHEGMQGEYYDCSACDYSLMEIHRGMKYCPYCGAKMDNPM